MPNDDFRAIAQRSTRNGFVSTCPFHFLLAKGALHPPRQPSRTQSLSALDVEEMETTFTKDMSDIPLRKDSRSAVLPIRKIQSTFPDMITVGRTANNDIVVADVSVSRFHAFFAVLDEGVALADAGSRNGTQVDGERLEPRGPATPVTPGSLVTFGKTDFYVLDAGSLWDRLRNPAD